MPKKKKQASPGQVQLGVSVPADEMRKLDIDCARFKRSRATVVAALIRSHLALKETHRALVYSGLPEKRRGRPL